MQNEICVLVATMKQWTNKVPTYSSEDIEKINQTIINRLAVTGYSVEEINYVVENLSILNGYAERCGVIDHNKYRRLSKDLHNVNVFLIRSTEFSDVAIRGLNKYIKASGDSIQMAEDIFSVNLFKACTVPEITSALTLCQSFIKRMNNVNMRVLFEAELGANIINYILGYNLNRETCKDLLYCCSNMGWCEYKEQLKPYLEHCVDVFYKGLPNEVQSDIKPSDYSDFLNYIDYRGVR